MSPTAARLRAAALTVALSLAATAARANGGGNVLPPNANPLGSSLAAISQQVILFTLSGNNPVYYPQIPFQVLYATNNQDSQYDPTTGVVTLTGSNTFTVRPGTMFYLPIQGVDNTPPSPGIFPTTLPQAMTYLFDPSQYGASFDVEVDGRTTTVGPEYTVLLQPVTLPDAIVDHLADIGTDVPYGFVYRAAQIGVFLSPMSVGQHTVVIRAHVTGAFLPDVYGITALQSEFTYTVNVVPPGRSK